MHRPSSADDPGSGTRVAWSDAEPSVLLLSLSGRVFTVAQELIFPTTGQGYFALLCSDCLNITACHMNLRNYFFHTSNPHFVSAFPCNIVTYLCAVVHNSACCHNTERLRDSGIMLV